MRRPIHPASFVVAVICTVVFLAAAQATPEAMQEAGVRQTVATTYYHTFFHGHPVMKRIRPGDTVVTKTLDAGGQDEKDVHRAAPGNPLTGPFYVEGAEPGDALVIHFKKIRPNRNWGFTSNRILLPALTPESIEGIYSNRYKEDLIRKGRSNPIPQQLELANRCQVNDH